MSTVAPPRPPALPSPATAPPPGGPGASPAGGAPPPFRADRPAPPLGPSPLRYPPVLATPAGCVSGDPDTLGAYRCVVGPAEEALAAAGRHLDVVLREWLRAGLDAGPDVPGLLATADALVRHAAAGRALAEVAAGTGAALAAADRPGDARAAAAGPGPGAAVTPTGRAGGVDAGTPARTPARTPSGTPAGTSAVAELARAGGVEAARRRAATRSGLRGRLGRSVLDLAADLGAALPRGVAAVARQVPLLALVLTPAWAAGAGGPYPDALLAEGAAVLGAAAVLAAVGAVGISLPLTASFLVGTAAGYTASAGAAALLRRRRARVTAARAASASSGG